MRENSEEQVKERRREMFLEEIEYGLMNGHDCRGEDGPVGVDPLYKRSMHNVSTGSQRINQRSEPARLLRDTNTRDSHARNTFSEMGDNYRGPIGDPRL